MLPVKRGKPRIEILLNEDNHENNREKKNCSFAKKPADILEANTDFIDEIGLKSHLSPTRANGLVSMIKQIKMYALAYQSQN